MGKVKRALGLMSGTSMDGIDVALLTTDGEDVVERGPSLTVPYGEPMRARLRSAIEDAQVLKQRYERPGCLAAVEREITQAHAAAVSELCKVHGIDRASLDVIGFHGQTVLHRAPHAEVQTTLAGVPFDEGVLGITVQLGDGPLLAKLTGIDVVYDMRAADVAEGGQGAPLVPVYHQALLARLPQRPLAVVNIGGVANVTWIGAGGRLIAFDTGPGNALIDDWMAKHAGTPCDSGGHTAARGKIDEDCLRDMMLSGFFQEAPPKSLDRNAFRSVPVASLSIEDGAATLTAFTAGAVARAREHMPEEPALWIVAGGGRKNATLMGMIAAKVENAVVPAEAVGLSGDALEAEAWGYLAVRSLHGMPLTFPGTTGVSKPMTGGIWAMANQN